jgi:hypothetical protein
MLQHGPIAVRRKAHTRCSEGCWIPIKAQDAQSGMRIKNCGGMASPTQRGIENNTVRDRGKKFSDLVNHYGVM